MAIVKTITNDLGVTANYLKIEHVTKITNNRFLVRLKLGLYGDKTARSALKKVVQYYDLDIPLTYDPIGQEWSPLAPDCTYAQIYAHLKTLTTPIDMTGGQDDNDCVGRDLLFPA